MSDELPDLNEFLATAGGADPASFQAPAVRAASPTLDLFFNAASGPQGYDSRSQDQADQLQEERRRASSMDESNYSRFMRSVAGVSQGFATGNALQLGYAQQRMQAGNPTQDDLRRIATHERLAEIKRNQTIPEAIADSIPEFLSMAGEAMVGGQMFRAAAPGATAATGLAAVPGFLGRTAATQASMPGMWNVPHGIETNMQEGRNPLDPRGLGSGAALGFIQTAVLSRMNAFGADRVTMGGAQGVLARGALRTTAGLAEMQGADIATSAADDLAQATIGRSLGINTRYGTFGSFIRGDDDAMKHALVQAITFAAFAGLHEYQHGRPQVRQPGEPAPGPEAPRGPETPPGEAEARPGEPAAEATPGEADPFGLGPQAAPEARPAQEAGAPEAHAGDSLMRAFGDMVDSFGSRGWSRARAGKEASRVTEELRGTFEGILKQFPDATRGEVLEMFDGDTPYSRYARALVDILIPEGGQPKPPEAPRTVPEPERVATPAEMPPEAPRGIPGPQEGPAAQAPAPQEPAQPAAPVDPLAHLSTEQVKGMAKGLGLSGAGSREAVTGRLQKAFGDRFEDLAAASRPRPPEPTPQPRPVEPVAAVPPPAPAPIPPGEPPGSPETAPSAPLAAPSAPLPAPTAPPPPPPTAPHPLVERMRRKQQGLAEIPTKSEAAWQAEVAELVKTELSRKAANAEERFARVKYEDIPPDLKGRVEKVIQRLAGTRDPADLRQVARSAFASVDKKGNHGLHELLAAWERRKNPPPATPEALREAEMALRKAKIEEHDLIKEFNDEVYTIAKRIKDAPRFEAIREADRRSIERHLQRAAQDIAVVDPAARDAAATLPAAAPAAPAVTPPAKGRKGRKAPKEETFGPPAPPKKQLSSYESMRRNHAIPKEYEAQAKEAGIPPDHLHAMYHELRAVDRQGVAEFNALRNALKDGLKATGMTESQIRRIDKSKDAASVRFLDEVASELTGDHAHTLEKLRSRTADHEAKYDDVAFDVIVGGNRKPASERDLYAKALDESHAAMESAKRIQKDIDDANRRLEQSGQEPVSREDIERLKSEAQRELEDEFGSEAKPQASPEPTQGDAYEPPGGSTDIGDFPFGDEQGGEPGAQPGGEPRGPKQPPGPIDRAADLTKDFLSDEGGWLDPKAIADYAKETYQSIKAGTIKVQDYLGELAGKMGPRTTRLSQESGEALARFVAAPGYAREAAPHYIDKVMGKDATPDQRRLAGATITEGRLRYMRHAFAEGATEAANTQQHAEMVANMAKAAKASALKNGNKAAAEQAQAIYDSSMKEAEKAKAKAKADGDAASKVGTIVGKPDSPFAREKDYKDAVASPWMREVFQRYRDHFVPIMEENYRKAEGMDPNDPIDARTQIPGFPVNLKAIRSGDPITEGAVFTNGGRGNLKNVRLRKLGWAEKAKGTADGYDIDMGAIISNSLEKSVTLAAKHDMMRTMVDEGIARWGVGGQKIDIKGEAAKEVPFVRPPKKTQANQPKEDTLYVHPSSYPEIRKALAVDQPLHIPVVTEAARLLTSASLASTVEAAYHGKNLLTMLSKPRVGFISALVNGYKVVTKNPEIQARLVELARIGALKEGGMETGPMAKYNPLKWMGSFLEVMQKTMRLTAEDAFESMRKSGLVIGSETNKRDFINQLGQYNRKAQNSVVAMLRDTGLGPFATAGTNFYMQGLKGLAMDPGVKATSMKAAVQLRAEMLAKAMTVTVGTALANYFMWGRWDGDDNTPLGALKVGESGGKTRSINLTNLIGLTRGARQTGLLAILEGKRRGSSTPAIVDKATDDIVHSLMHPAVGPVVQFAHTAITGNNAFGQHITGHTSNDASHAWANLKVAISQANPVYATMSGADRPHQQDNPLMERVSRLAGPFGVQTRPKLSYGEQIQAEERRRKRMR